MQVDHQYAAARWELPPRLPLHLDLFNFDAVAAWDSPVVLTSPRSLAACRRAGVKASQLLSYTCCECLPVYLWW